MHYAKKTASLALASCLAFALAGCDDDKKSGGAAAAPAAFSGTAAVGAPLANADIVVRCSAGDEITTTTNSDGEYSVSTTSMEDAGAELPCALQVTLGDVVLYSFAADTGVINITPFTDLAVAYALTAAGAGDAETWFSAETLDGDSVDENLADAITELQDALVTATGESSVSFNFFTTAFNADGVSTYDLWLDRLNEALADDGSEYADLLAGFIAGSGFGTIVIDVTPITGGGDGSTLYVTTSVSGVAGIEVAVAGVAAPANQTEFCDGSFNEYIDASGSLTITGCSFSGNTGTITSTVSVTQPFPITISYETIYEWR